MNLSGRYVLSMPFSEPQPITVTSHNGIYILQIRDRYDRYNIYQSRYIGFQVTEFKPRIKSVSRLVVYGAWKEAIFIDETGKQFDVKVTA